LAVTVDAHPSSLLQIAEAASAGLQEELRRSYRKRGPPANFNQVHQRLSISVVLMMATGKFRFGEEAQDRFQFQAESRNQKEGQG
jgi:hypothetical protein